MPNLTIKPVAAAGNKVIIQDQAGNTRLQTDDAGITLTTPNLGTPSAVTLTNATFPAGHVIKHSVKALKDTDNIISSGTAMFNSGIELVHATAKSSTDSYLKLDWYSGMTYKSAGGAIVYLDFTMTTAADTSYDVADSCQESDPSHYGTSLFYNSNNAYYSPISGTTYIGLETGMGVPPNKTTWSAGETLYFRLWYSVSSGTFRITHASSFFNMSVTEIQR